MISPEGLGIQHVEKSVFSPIPLDSDFAVGWRLPGQGSAYGTCGKWHHYEGCLDVASHNQMRLDGSDHVGQVYIKKIHQSCYRADCPICFEDWVTREADRATYRILEFAKRHKIVHVTASVPLKDYSLPITKLREKVYKLIKKCGIWGGMLIYHPFRQNEITQIWYFSPHFHILGCGWVHGTKQEYEASGWVVKNIGVREPFTVIRYQLSHCGIHDNYHAVTWFGGMNYRFKIPKMPEQKAVCPICGQELQHVIYEGEQDPIVDFPKGGYWLNPGGWRYG